MAELMKALSAEELARHLPGLPGVVEPRRGAHHVHSATDYLDGLTGRCCRACDSFHTLRWFRTLPIRVSSPLPTPGGTLSEPLPAPGGGLLDRLAASAKQAIGRVVGSDDLVEEGALQARKADVAAETAHLDAEAEQAQQRTELSAEKAHNSVEQTRVQADLAERDRTEQIERDERAAKEAAARLEAHQQEMVAAQQGAQEAALDREQVDVAVEEIHGAHEAAEIEAEARRAEMAADALEAARKNLDQQSTGG